MKDEEKVIYRTGPGGVVEVLRTSRKITFVCTNCGCHFRVPVHLAPERQTDLTLWNPECQTGLQEYMHSYKCPECGDECLSTQCIKIY